MLFFVPGGLAVRQPAAGFINRSGVDSRVAHLNERDLSLEVHNIGHTIRHAIRAQCSVGFRGGTIFEIAEEGERELQLFREDSLRGGVISTNAKYLCFITFEFCDTSLVRGEFFGSATGERGREERHNNCILAFEIGQGHLSARSRRQREIRRDIANLEGLRVARLLGYEPRD